MDMIMRVHAKVCAQHAIMTRNLDAERIAACSFGTFFSASARRPILWPPSRRMAHPG
jgi:hypothetical protein